MPILSHPAFGPRTAIIYITAGALIDVWTIVWYLAFGRESAGGINNNTQFWLWGFFLTGLTLVVVGLLLGRIGQAARKSEMPPSDAVAAEAQIQNTVAANPQQVVAAPAAPGATPANASPNVIMPAPVAATGQQFVPGVTRQ